VNALKTLRSFILLSLLISLLVGAIVPSIWLYTANTLATPINSAMEIETALRLSIEAERQSAQIEIPAKHRKSVKWARPESSSYPKRMTALFITETGCPTYFQTPREDGWPWTKRVLISLVGGREPDGDGACELIFARSLARRLGAKTALDVAVSADRIHKFLEKDQLVSWNLSSMQFDRGLIGVEEAALDVLQKPLAELSDAELAELQLAIPPWGYWDDIHQCKNASLVRDSRDMLIKHLAGQGLISDEMARTAIAQPVRCMQVKR
jgi:hypothetical protein